MAEKKSFETAIEELDEIVASLESGDLPLKEAIKSYSASQKLITLCERELNQAEKRLKKLVVKPTENISENEEPQESLEI